VSGRNSTRIRFDSKEYVMVTTKIPPTEAEIELCAQCAREPKKCVCSFVEKVKNRIHVLVIQHPQEPGVDIATLPIVQQALSAVTVKIGLSWASLKKILDREVEAKRWGILYLGSVRTEQLPKEGSVFAVDKKGAVLPDQAAILKRLEGIIVIDGTWSQAKALWWRNAWALKCTRLVLNSGRRSVYDAIRKEPRKGCLSTIEAIGEVLSVLENKESIRESLQKPLVEFVSRHSKKGTARGSRNSQIVTGD
jgi:DTW domain-containing protein YfiP